MKIFAASILLFLCFAGLGAYFWHEPCFEYLVVEDAIYSNEGNLADLAETVYQMHSSGERIPAAGTSSWAECEKIMGPMYTDADRSGNWSPNAQGTSIYSRITYLQKMTFGSFAVSAMALLVSIIWVVKGSWNKE